MSKQINIAALQNNPAAVQALLALLGGAQPRKARSGKSFTKKAIASAEETEARRKAMDEATVKAFTKAGYKDIQPRINVLTYGKVKDDGTKTGWLGQGRKVKTGEKAVHVKAPGMRGKGMPMFYIGQTEELATEANTAPQA